MVYGLEVKRQEGIDNSQKSYVIRLSPMSKSYV